jgi:hypothetical protein
MQDHHESNIKVIVVFRQAIKNPGYWPGLGSQKAYGFKLQSYWIFALARNFCINSENLAFCQF